MANGYLKSLLGTGEEILLVSRQHWLVLLGEIASEVLLSIAFIVLVGGISIFIGPLALLGLILLVVPGISLTRDVLIWSNRQFVITNFRVIQVSGVFSKNVTDSSLEKVNDVKMAQSFMGRLLDYGDIEILTASEIGVNNIRRIARPVKYKTTMVNAKSQLEQGAAQRPLPQKGSDVPAIISQLDALRKQGTITEEEFQSKKKDLLAKM